MVFMPAPNTVVIAMPESTTVKRDTPAFSDITKMTAAVASAPTNAAQGEIHGT